MKFKTYKDDNILYFFDFYRILEELEKKILSESNTSIDILNEFITTFKKYKDIEWFKRFENTLLLAKDLYKIKQEKLKHQQYIKEILKNNSPANNVNYYPKKEEN